VILGSALAAVMSISLASNAQAQTAASPIGCYIWIDVLTGKAVRTVPVNRDGVIHVNGFSDPNNAHDPKTGDNFASPDDGQSWINVQTGQYPPTVPVNPEGPIHVNGFSDPNNAHDRKTGKNYARVPCPPSNTQTSWTGPFGGAQVVGSWSHVSTNEFLATTGVQTNHFDDSGNGFGGGVNGGFNWMPWGGNIVTGVVFDTNFLNDNVNHTFAGGTFIGSTVNFEASADVRAGVLTTPNLLLYGQTGVSVANQRLQINFGGPITDTTQWTAGYNLGGGAEWMLPANVFPWGRSTSLFISYDHTWWDKASLTTPAASPPYNYTWLRQSDAVMAGFRIQFGDPGVAVSPSGAPMAVKAPPPK
jgi:hypothetical protein